MVAVELRSAVRRRPWWRLFVRARPVRAVRDGKAFAEVAALLSEDAG